MYNNYGIILLLVYCRIVKCSEANCSILYNVIIYFELQKWSAIGMPSLERAKSVDVNNC